MVRLAIEGNGESYFVDQFLFHLVLDGPRNDRYESFSTQQRAFVVNVMKYLLETQAEEIENNLDTDRLFQALEIWDRDSDA
jgi:phage portal protein BeeE